MSTQDEFVVASSGTKVVLIFNIAPQVTKDQMHTLFGFLGNIKDIRLYPTIRHASVPIESRICFIKFFDQSTVAIAQHMTNTVFMDRALIVIPYQTSTGEIPDEHKAVVVADIVKIVPGLHHSSPKLPSHVTSQIEGMPPNQFITTHDPLLEHNGLPPYPPLSVTYDAKKVEEIRRTLIVFDVKSISAHEIIAFFTTAGDVNYVRFCTRESDSYHYALVEFSDQRSIILGLQMNGSKLLGKIIQVYHATQAIIKPMAKSNEVAQREVEEAMERVREERGWISAAGFDPVTERPCRERRQGRRRSFSRRSRSRPRRRSYSRCRSGSRHRSRHRRSRSRSWRSRSRARHQRLKYRKRSSTRSISRGKRSRRSTSRRRTRSKSRPRSSRSQSVKSRSPRRSMDRDRKRDNDRKSDDSGKAIKSRNYNSKTSSFSESSDSYSDKQDFDPKSGKSPSYSPVQKGTRYRSLSYDSASPNRRSSGVSPGRSRSSYSPGIRGSRSPSSSPRRQRSSLSYDSASPNRRSSGVSPGRRRSSSSPGIRGSRSPSSSPRRQRSSLSYDSASPNRRSSGVSPGRRRSSYSPGIRGSRSPSSSPRRQRSYSPRTSSSSPAGRSHQSSSGSS